MVTLTQLKQFVDATIVANAVNTSTNPHQHQHDEVIDILSQGGPEAASDKFNDNIMTLSKNASNDAAIRIKGASVRLMAIWFDTLRAKLQQALLRPTDLFNEFSSNPNEDNLAVFMDAFLEFNQEMDQLLSVGGDEENGNNNTTTTTRIGPVGNPFEINDRLLDLYKMAIGSAIGVVQGETVKNFKAVSNAVTVDVERSHTADNDVHHHNNSVDEGNNRQLNQNYHGAKKTTFGGINFSQVGGERSPPIVHTNNNDSEFHSLPRDRDVLDDETHNNNRQGDHHHLHHDDDDDDLVKRSYPTKNEYDDASSEYNLRFGNHQQHKQQESNQRHVDPIRVNLQRIAAPTRTHPHHPDALTSTQPRRQPDAMSTASVAASDDPGVAEHIQHTKRKKFAIAEKVGGGGGAAPLSVAEERLQASRSSRIEAQRNAAKGGTPARSASAGVGGVGASSIHRVGGRAPSASASTHQYSVADAMRHDVDHELPIRGRAGKQYKSSDPNSIANVSNDDYYNNHHHHHADVNVSASSIDTTGSCGVSTNHTERMQEEKRRKIAEYERSIEKQRNDYFQHLQKERIIPTTTTHAAPDSSSSQNNAHHQRNIISSMFDSGASKTHTQRHAHPAQHKAQTQHQSDVGDDDSEHHRTVLKEQRHASHIQLRAGDDASSATQTGHRAERSPHYQEPLHRQLPSPRVNPDADRPNSRRPQPHTNNRDSPMMAHQQQDQHHHPSASFSAPHQNQHSSASASTPRHHQQSSSSQQPPPPTSTTTSETSKMTQLRIEMASLKKQLSASQSGSAGGSQEIQYYAIHKRMQRVRAEMIQEQRDIDAVAHMEEDRKSLQRDLQAKRKQFKR